jgi:hypothetical protein
MSPPLHVLHAQVTVVPAGIVLAAGLNALFVTEIPPVGTGVFPTFPTGPVVSPPPPHAAAEIKASMICKVLVVITFLHSGNCGPNDLDARAPLPFYHDAAC